MITCKEDLHSTWIKNDKGELRDLYISAAKLFGLVDKTAKGGLPFIGIFSEWEGCQIIGNTNQLLLDQEKRKQLTISDFKKSKPTPTRFVKVEESIFDLRGEFKRGELYEAEVVDNVNVGYRKIKSEHDLICAMNGIDYIYRQVEIDWRDEVKKTYDAVKLPVGERGKLYMGESWDEQEFIKFCHLVASLTEKPEGV